MQKINVRKLAGILNAYQNCIESNNEEWRDKHEASIEGMLKALPHGSGFDDGVKLDWENSTSERLIFTLGFHHMDEHGGYDGWTYHKITITASLHFGYKMRITGEDKNGIFEYIQDTFNNIFYC